MHTPTNTHIRFSQRYNKTIGRSVYYARSNTMDESTMLAALCRQLHIRDWRMRVMTVRGYAHAIKVIDTQLGVPIGTDARW